MSALRKCPACHQLMDQRRRLCRACFAALPPETKRRVDAARAHHNAGRMPRRDYLHILELAIGQAAQLRNPQLSLL